MPQRAERGVLNPVFTGLVAEIKASDFGLAHEAIFPKRTFRSNGDGKGFFRKYDLGESLRLLDRNTLIRRPGTPAYKVDRGRELETFKTQRTHLDAVVSDDEAALVAQTSMGGEDLHASETRWTRELMLLSKEYEAAQRVQGADFVGFSSTLTATDKFDNPDSDPTQIIPDFLASIRSRSGMPGNVLGMPYPVALALAKHPKIQAKRGANERQALTVDALSELLTTVFGLKRVVVMNNMYAPSRAEGQPAQLVEIWGNILLGWYEPNNPGFFEPTWAVQAIDTFYYGGNEVEVRDIRDEDSESTYHRVKEDYEFVCMHKELAARLDGVLT